MSQWIYFVGKPYPKAANLSIFRENNYKLGVFLDKRISLKAPQRFDNIIKVDFSSPEAIKQSVSNQVLQIDGLLCSYENYVVAKSQIAEIFGLPATSLASARMSTDKFLMRQAFWRANPAITPKFEQVDSLSEALYAAKKLDFPLVIKPANLIKSLLVLKCNNQVELIHNFKYAQQKIASLYKKYRVYGQQPKLISEQYIQGKTCSIAAFVDKAGEPHFCQGIVSLLNAQDIGIDDNYVYRRMLPGEFDKTLEKKMFAAAAEGIRALNMSSVPAHVELIYNDREVKLIEIGARVGGYRPRMYSLSYHQDLIAQEVKLALGQAPNLQGKKQAYTAVYELFPPAEGEYAGMQGSFDESVFTYYRVKAKPGQTVGPAKSGYKAVAVTIVSSPNKSKFDSLCKSVSGMKVTIN